MLTSNQSILHNLYHVCLCFVLLEDLIWFLSNLFDLCKRLDGDLLTLMMGCWAWLRLGDGLLTRCGAKTHHFQTLWPILSVCWRQDQRWKFFHGKKGGLDFRFSPFQTLLSHWCTRQGSPGMYQTLSSHLFDYPGYREDWNFLLLYHTCHFLAFLMVSWRMTW